MNIVDVIILLGIGLGAVSGFLRGFFKQTVLFVGTILVVVLSFILKNSLSLILYENLPFFGMAGLTSLNILLYEALAFIICIAILTIALNIVIKISGIIEKLLKVTIVLALPTKLLGMVVGAIEGIVILYVILFIASMPVFKLPFVNESKYANIILTKTPIVSSITTNAVNTFNEIAEFTKNEIDMKDIDNTNRKIVEVMLENEVVTADSIELLVKKEKLKIDNSSELIEKYKEA